MLMCFTGGYLLELITSLDHSGAKYTVLYVSDPYNPIPYSFPMGRLLAENASGNASLHSTAFCDGICQVKKTLLEAIFVVSPFLHHSKMNITMYFFPCSCFTYFTFALSNLPFRTSFLCVLYPR